MRLIFFFWAIARIGGGSDWEGCEGWQGHLAAGNVDESDSIINDGL